MVKRHIIRWLALPLLTLFLSTTVLVACSQPATTQPSPKPPTATPVSQLPEKLHWDVSVWGGPRSFTFPIEDWAKDMKAGTNGRWEIAVSYGEVLAPSKDAPDGLKSKAFEACLICSMYHPGKTPLMTVMENPFMSPGNMTQEGEWLMAVAQHPALVKELDAWNARIVFAAPMPLYNFMGKKPIKAVEDFKNMRVRIDPVGGKPLEEFGAVISNIPAGEIYTALERGMLDSVCWSWSYTFGNYKIYELSKYATVGIDLKTTPIYLVANKDAWNALPDEWKKLSEESAAKAVARYVKYNDADDAKWLPAFSKAGIEITTFSPAERAKLVAKAQPCWEAWVKEMTTKGLPGKEVLDFAIAKRDAIVAKATK